MLLRCAWARKSSWRELVKVNAKLANEAFVVKCRPLCWHGAAPHRFTTPLDKLRQQLLP
jgi:hypothetical protein